MGGILPLDYDTAKAKIELEQQIAIDSASYRIFAQQQSFGRAVRGGLKKGEVKSIIASARGSGKTMITRAMVENNLGFFSEGEKEVENNDVKQAEIDYIGELIVDTRNYDIDEENMGIVLLDSSVISLTGGVTTELRFKDRLFSENIPKLLGIDKLDECEVDIGVFRYVFGFNESTSILSGFSSEATDTSNAQLISKHKYPYSDEEFLDKEYGDV